MNIKTFVPVILLISIMFSGCAAEVEYWIKRMEEAEKKSAEKLQTRKPWKHKQRCLNSRFPLLLHL